MLVTLVGFSRKLAPQFLRDSKGTAEIYPQLLGGSANRYPFLSGVPHLHRHSRDIARKWCYLLQSIEAPNGAKDDADEGETKDEGKGANRGLGEGRMSMQGGNRKAKWTSAKKSHGKGIRF